MNCNGQKSTRVFVYAWLNYSPFVLLFSSKEKLCTHKINLILQFKHLFIEVPAYLSHLLRCCFVNTTETTFMVNCKL